MRIIRSLFILLASYSQVLEVFLSYAYRIVNLLMDTSNKLWASAHEDDWTEIGVALTECLSRISDPYGSCSVINHQYLRLISFILRHTKFHHTGMMRLVFLFTLQDITIFIIFSVLLNNLLQSMLRALQRQNCPETISLCRFTSELWIQLLSHSYVRQF